ncbi:MAG: PAS domain-containing sensor histidine kinase [Proteobacteria bacterium]|nr:MAG: PAS domain-containing sensor histidine kinase [Pseudomonadota bacterium]
MRVRTQLLLAGAPLAVALVALGAFAIRSIDAMEASAQAILAQNYRSVLAAQRMKETLERIDDDAYFAATGRPPRSAAQIEAERRLFESELRVEEGNVTEPGEAELASGLREQWTAYQRHLDACLRIPAGPEAQACYFRELRARADALRLGADRVLALNQDAMALKGERARREAQRVGTAMAAAVAGALVLGLALSAWLATRALRPLGALGRAVEQLGRGDFAVRAPVRGGAEIAQLAGAFNAMAERLAEYRTSSLGEMLQVQLAAQSTLDSLTDPVFVFAPSGSVLLANRAAEDLLACGGRETPDVRHLEPALRDAIEALRAHVLHGKGAFAPKSFDDAVAIARPDGERVFLPRAAPVYEEGGGVVGATVVLQDVTRLRRFEELRDDLVSTVAHQFRTPLTSLRMAIHLCLEGVAGPLTEKQQDLLHAAREECERLQGIVDELLDLARLQSGTVALVQEEVLAESLLDRAVHEVAAAAAARHVELAAEPAAGVAVRVDPERIQLVFSNLLENALRHAPAGGHVTARASLAEHAVRFEVEDDGPGIAEADRPHVFEKFYRGSAGGGAGLGLAIARDIVRAHGGEMGVESEPGRTCFWFTLPAC